MLKTLQFISHLHTEQIQKLLQNQKSNLFVDDTNPSADLGDCICCLAYVPGLRAATVQVLFDLKT